MKLADNFSALKIKPTLHKFGSWPYPIPPIEYSTDSDSESREHVKANKLTKVPRKTIIKKSKFRNDTVYYSSGKECSDSGDADSNSETEPDYEWINFIRKRAADKAAAQANGGAATGGAATGGAAAGGAAIAT
ncbi:hypothetical protein M378DRAFT_18163 [Amanita muscaria Koide BX008]|uniref:Uncharacterized protein n=1 Tax=Amanita muscaria (strain Koide BX008) TaxID=946122 RepID=A0A0C2WF23_AMAMK|nr:hypothetical protein M378DRAFT_18163 [Amanita muscaria Koide BX008]